MTSATKNITAMIHLIFMQYMKHIMELLQERWECDLMTNPVKCMQQMFNHCQKVTVVFVTNTYCSPST